MTIRLLAGRGEGQATAPEAQPAFPGLFSSGWRLSQY
jgi:hypothetical protein